jgi:sugar transferase (PEP-CTERM/EpsH1 system associated)
MNIVWIKNNLLHPLDSGGKLRTYNMLRHIRKNHSVHYITFADPDKDRENIALADEYCTKISYRGYPEMPDKHSLAYYVKVLLGLAGKHPFTVTSYRSAEIEDLINDTIARGSCDVIVADFLSMCLNIPGNVDVPLVHFSHNVEAMIWERSARCERNPLKKIVFRRERARIERFERWVVGGYDRTISVSKNDYDHFSKVYGGTRLDYVSTGVDTGYFSPGEAAEEPGSVIFLGSMDWMPNADAVEYFTTSVYPLIKEEVPGAKLYIVGRNPLAQVRGLADKDSSVNVTGTVPDTRPYVARAACAVVPLRIGGGTRIKIYEMMSAGKAVVSTAIGAEGLDYIDGENIIIADGAEEFARAVVGILGDRERREKIGRNARAFVVEHCSWEKVSEQFIGFLENVTEEVDQ